MAVFRGISASLPGFFGIFINCIGNFHNNENINKSFENGKKTWQTGRKPFLNKKGDKLK